MITAENLIKIYPNNVKALDGISFNIERGEVCAYLGANGAGKSTTIKIICGMLSASSGSAYVNGLNVAEFPNRVKKIIGYVPESGELFLSLTPYDFLEFVCRMYDIDKEVYNHRIFSFLDLFGLKNEVRTPMHTFSKGMRQKVLLVSSLIHNPEVIFWDEPLSGIDYSTSVVVRNLIKDMSAAGKTFFYSTHQVESIDKICTKILILNSGKIAFDASLSSLNGENIDEIMSRYAGAGDITGKTQGLYSGAQGER